MAAPATIRNVTDRAQRYRAQNNVRGEKRCVMCGSTKDLGVMHLDGNESHGEQANLAWGCRSCNQKLAAAFKAIGAGRPTKQYNPASKGVPTFDQYAWAVSNHSRGEHDEAGAIIHATPKSKRIEYASRIWSMRRERGTDSSMPDWARNPGKGGKVWNAYVHGQYLGTVEGATKAAALKKARSKFGPSVHTSKRGGIAVQRNPRNPADAAASMSERFHGRPVLEVKEVDEKVHYHTHLAELGELERLKVKALDGAIVKLEDFGGALLCSNEDGTQLFIRGGDQSVDPEDFGVEEPFHDKECLGDVIEVRYFTTKDHLGKDGGEATYYHEFGEEDKAKGNRPRRPELHYSTRDGRLSFVGGGYTIEPEGITN